MKCESSEVKEDECENRKGKKRGGVNLGKESSHWANDWVTLRDKIVERMEENSFRLWMCVSVRISKLELTVIRFNLGYSSN